MTRWAQSVPRERSGYSDPYWSRAAAEPDIAPRADPVVYSTGPSPVLDPDQLAHYESNGFAELDGLFTGREIDALLEEARRLQSQPESVDQDTLIAEPDSQALRSVFRIHEQSPLIARLVRDPRLLGLAEHLLGDRVYVHQSRLNYKPGFAGKEFYWHSDFETWHIEDGMPRMRALSLSISLTENTPVNGPLMLISGSHLDYVRCVGETPDDHYRQSLRRQEYGVPDAESLRILCHRGPIVAPVGPPGNVVLFECNTMHGSNSNISPQPRSNLFIVYNSVTNHLLEPFGGKPPRPAFIASRSPEPLAALPGPFLG